MNQTHDLEEVSERIQSQPRSNLRDRGPASIETQVMAVTSSSTLNDLAAALDASDWLLSRAKMIDGLIKQIAINWIDYNGEFDIGSKHYSVGYTTTVKCLDVPQTGHAVLKACSGDLGQFFDLLVAQPFKYGSVRRFIDAALYKSLFRPQSAGRLIDGVPPRVLKRTDPTFVPARPH